MYRTFYCTMHVPVTACGIIHHPSFIHHSCLHLPGIISKYNKVGKERVRVSILDNHRGLLVGRPVGCREQASKQASKRKAVLDCGTIHPSLSSCPPPPPHLPGVLGLPGCPKAGGRGGYVCTVHSVLYSLHNNNLWVTHRHFVHTIHTLYVCMYCTYC